MRHPNQPTSPGPTPAPDPSVSAGPRTPQAVAWAAVLDALREAGTHDGASAAEWWAQDTIGAHASGDTARTARAVLAGLDDGDPAVCDTLPACNLPGQPGDPNTARSYTDAAPLDAPAWETLDAARAGEAIDAYHDGFATAVEHEAAWHCHTILGSADIDPTDLDPNRMDLVGPGPAGPGVHGHHVAGTATGEEHGPPYTVLVHTPGLRLPHGRLAVTSLQQMPTHNGVAFVADLALDGRFVGRIENEGNGGGTFYLGLNSSRFNHQDLHEFALACRRDDGEPVTPEWVLDALVDEYDLGRQVTAATAAGATLARLLDEYGLILDLQKIAPRPVTPADRAAIAGRLAARAAQFAGTRGGSCGTATPGAISPAPRLASPPADAAAWSH